MNTYEVRITTEDIGETIEVEAEDAAAAELAGYEYFDTNYWDHRECVEFAVEALPVA